MQTFASDATIINFELHHQQVKPLFPKNSLRFLKRCATNKGTKTNNNNKNTKEGVMHQKSLFIYGNKMWPK